MLRLRIAPMLALLVLLSASLPAHAFFDPPWITPADPKAGDTVSINIHGGICDAIAERAGYPKITREGNSIRIVHFGVHYEPGDELCIFGVGTVTTPVGVYVPGAYTLTVELAYQDPVFGTPAILPIGVVPFTVEAPAAAPAPAPALNFFGMTVLSLLVLCIVAWVFHKRRASLLLLLALTCIPFGARGQDTQSIQVLLTNAPGAPTPASIVAWMKASHRSGTPPLQAFQVKPPVRGDFLIADRATGDFLAWLDRNPHSARKKLEDHFLATFYTADVAAALTALQSDPYVAQATLAPAYQSSSVDLINAGIDPEPAFVVNDGQYGRLDMNIDAAWLWSGGNILIGQIDMGLYENHPALRQFSGNTYVGGNFVKAASKDVGLTGQSTQAGFDPENVDEKKAMWIDAGSCTSTGALLTPAILGHGTHVAGLLGANEGNNVGIQGTCKHCGIAAWKDTYLICFIQETPARVIPTTNPDAIDVAKTQTIDIGVQALSFSFGSRNNDNNLKCTSLRAYPMCLTITYAVSRDVPIIAASGNKREGINFPASDERVISAGGFQQSLALWDDASGCPAAPYSSECGSNFSKASGGIYFSRQELIGSAKRVLSTTYPNTTWGDYAECGDGYGTPMGDGIGWCTGTSMSAPQIAGVVGLLRSINPLVPVSTPEPVAGAKPGLRTVLAQTASRVGAWDARLGYGIPDAAAAARRMLGTVAGATVRNRVTPLFRLYQATVKDFAETTSPQYALSLMINQDKNYVQPASGLGKQPVVPGYTFPWDPIEPGENVETGIYDTTAPATPRASIYVLTTEYRPRPEWPNLIPLHLMDKPKSGGTDYLLATSKLEIEAAHAAGYNLRTIQGYIYQPCTPESTCVPPGAQKLWRQYKTADNDCAVFLDSEKPNFEAAGYTAACSTGSTKMIGYAYSATDSDGDGLPDGFEYVVGTNPNSSDSDGDGISDASEFPLAGIATGDPCMGGSLGARNCGADRIFKNGFDAP